jgi:hypothetical protein
MAYYKNLDFTFSATQDVVRDCKIVTETIEELSVLYDGDLDETYSKIDTERYGVEITCVMLGLEDVTNLLRAFADTLMDAIQEAALRDFRERMELHERKTA